MRLFFKTLSVFASLVLISFAFIVILAGFYLSNAYVSYHSQFKNRIVEVVPAFLGIEKTVETSPPSFISSLIPSGGGLGCFSALFQNIPKTAQTISEDGLQFFHSQSSASDFNDWQAIDFPWAGDDFKSLALLGCTQNLNSLKRLKEDYRQNTAQLEAFYSCHNGMCIMVIPQYNYIVLGGWD